jgi:hypothetical protein
MFFLLNQLSKGTEVHLGALGTRFLEHFFGLMRRQNHGDDRFSVFLRSVEKTVLLSHLRVEQHINMRIDSRLSDSGSRIDESDPISLRCLGCDIAFAKGIIERFADFDVLGQDDLGTLSACCETFDEQETLEDFLNVAFQSHLKRPRKRRGRSTKSEALNKTGGLSQVRKQESKSALTRLSH